MSRGYQVQALMRATGGELCNNALSLQPSLSPTLLPVTVQQARAPAAPALLAPPACPLEPIEIEIHGDRIRLHSAVDAQRLGVVLEALARHA